MSQVVSVRLSDELGEQLEQRAKAEGQSLGLFIQEALKKLVAGTLSSGQKMVDIPIDLPPDFIRFIETWPEFKGRMASDLVSELMSGHAFELRWQEMVRAYNAG